jgi:hypothetical protein
MILLSPLRIRDDSDTSVQMFDEELANTELDSFRLPFSNLTLVMKESRNADKKMNNFVDEFIKWIVFLIVAIIVFWNEYLQKLFVPKH